MFLLYNLVLSLLAPLWAPVMFWRSSRRAEKPNWAERAGDFPFRATKDSRRIWVHAVSVGEVMAALPFLKALRERLPSHDIVLSVTTSSGHATARDKAMPYVKHLVYFPVDVVRFQMAAMTRVRPEVVAIMETELWPNFLWAAKAFDAKTVLVNGRISDRSFRRSRWVLPLYRWMLRQVDAALMQTEGDAERIRALGAGEVRVVGNTKFDEAAQIADEGPRWRAELGLGEAFVVVVGSTRSEMEEDLVVAALDRAFGDAIRSGEVRVVHAPRHLERAPDVLAKASARFGSAALRTSGSVAPYLVLDTYGELGGVYSAADAVVVGGGFDRLGGQNILQPLALGKPVLHGPHMHNFRDIAAASLEAGASASCADAEALADRLSAVRGDPELRGAMGEAARALVRANLGAGNRYAEAVAALIEGA